MPNIDMSPAGVHAAANSIDEATKSALANVKYALAPSRSAVSDNPGWTSAAALAECSQSWTDHLTDLVNRTSHAADNLRASASEYEETDRRITESLQALHWESE